MHTQYIVTLILPSPNPHPTLTLPSPSVLVKVFVISMVLPRPPYGLPRFSFLVMSIGLCNLSMVGLLHHVSSYHTIAYQYTVFYHVIAFLSYHPSPPTCHLHPILSSQPSLLLLPSLLLHPSFTSSHLLHPPCSSIPLITSLRNACGAYWYAHT